MWVFSPVSRKKNRKMHTFWRCLSYWKCAISISLPEGKRVWQKMRNCIFLFVPRLWPILLYPMQPWHGVWLDLPHRDEVNQSRPKIPSRANMQLFWVSVLIEPNGSNWPSPWKSSDCVKPLGKCFFPFHRYGPVLECQFAKHFSKSPVFQQSQARLNLKPQHVSTRSMAITNTQRESHLTFLWNWTSTQKMMVLKFQLNSRMAFQWTGVCFLSMDSSPCRRDRQSQGHVCVWGIAWLCLIWSWPAMPSTRCPKLKSCGPNTTFSHGGPIQTQWWTDIKN